MYGSYINHGLHQSLKKGSYYQNQSQDIETMKGSEGQQVHL